MGRRSALLDFDDLTFELVARAQLLHGVLLPKIRPYGTMPPLLRSPSATVLHRLPRNEKHLNCLFDGALKRALAVRPPIAAAPAQRSHALPARAGRRLTE